jgi:polyhydroxyalkanoate synthase
MNEKANGGTPTGRTHGRTPEARAAHGGPTTGAEPGPEAETNGPEPNGADPNGPNPDGTQTNGADPNDTRRGSQQQTTTGTGPTARRGQRLGPRPLPAHLAAAIWTWTSSQTAWPAWKNGWLPWKEPGGQAAAATAGSSPAGNSPAGSSRAAKRESLRREIANADPGAFAAALQRETTRRHLDLLRGIQAYRAHPYTRALADPPALWQEGTTRLLDYGQCPEAADPNGPPLLVVPSLINRAYILDLKPELSLLRHLAGLGFRPLLVDWDRPGAQERGFSLTDYIAGRLERALDAACQAAGRPMPAVGYCMGGLLALALAERRQRDVTALALLATPWDFHADPDSNASGAGGHSQAPQARVAATGAQALEPTMQTLGVLPVDALQTLFQGLDPLTGVRKFLTFAHLNPDSPKAETFVALEDWLNDGVPLAAAVARECLYGWYGRNDTARGRWKIAGRPVDPARVRQPTLCLLPAQDRIVPPASAAALGTALPNAEVQRPPLGHIGMVVSGKAKAEAWAPLTDWLARLRR